MFRNLNGLEQVAYYWKYDDGSYGLAVLREQYDPIKDKALKDKCVDHGVYKDKDQLDIKLNEIKEQCKANEVDFEKEKLKIRNGLSYVSEHELFGKVKERDQKTCSWEELTKFLNSCGTGTENRREVLRLFSSILSESLASAEKYFFECLNLDRYKVGATLDKLEIMIPRSLENFSVDFVIYPFIFNMIKYFDGIRNDAAGPNEVVNQILFEQIQQITQASLLHKKSIKRFVNDYFSDGHKPIQLNPAASNRKAAVLFYAVFTVGKSGIEKLDDSTFRQLMRKAFALNGDSEFTVTNELEQQLKEEMIKDSNYSDILEQGAKIIKAWV